MEGDREQLFEVRGLVVVARRREDRESERCSLHAQMGGAETMVPQSARLNKFWYFLKRDSTHVTLLSSGSRIKRWGSRLALINATQSYKLQHTPRRQSTYLAHATNVASYVPNQTKVSPEFCEILAHTLGFSSVLHHLSEPKMSESMSPNEMGSIPVVPLQCVLATAKLQRRALAS